MKAFLLSLFAVLSLGYSNTSHAQVGDVHEAKGRFYCNGAFDFNQRMDVDFFGTTADVQAYNTSTGASARRFGNFDRFRSNTMTTYYQLNDGGYLEFPSNYENLHWFELTYEGFNGWIRFDCNHF